MIVISLMKYFLFISILLFLSSSYSQEDSLKIFKIQEEVKILSNKVEETRRDQLNYSLEKDLLKETYSNNYDRLNFTITGIFGVFAVLTFFGIRDLNSIKKEYKEELDKLTNLKVEIE